MLDLQHCRQRQQRLCREMARLELDAVVVSDHRHVYYFTGCWPFWLHEAVAVIRADGTTTLVTGREPASETAADRFVGYESNWAGTQRQDQADGAAATVAPLLSGLGAIAFDRGPASGILCESLDTEPTHIEPILWQMRRSKDADELALMKRAIDCTRAMYDRARQIIEPGVSELRVYSELRSAAEAVAGEALTPAYLGNDFTCGGGGGLPRPGRVAQAGELYILDLGPAYRGYFADNARVFSVDRKPTDAQMKAWTAIAGVFPLVERIAKPGVRCRDLYAAVDDHLKAATGTVGLSHHLGHGVGLQPHEFPHLNPQWDDTLIEGEIFTCEPGLYGDHLRGGIRIENQYRVTAGGVENLTPWGTEL